MTASLPIATIAAGREALKLSGPAIEWCERHRGIGPSTLAQLDVALGTGFCDDGEFARVG